MKKVTVEMNKLYKRTGKERRGEEHGRKRERIRRQKMFHAAASIIQKRFRIFSAKKEMALKRVRLFHCISQLF